MDKVLRSAVNYTFGSTANSRSSGKKNSKSNKGDSKATREFIEKEIISNQEKNEMKEISQLTAFCDSDGQSYGTSEEEVEIECSQQQSGQETTKVEEPCYVSQECGQACLAVQEEDALSGDEICQQQSKQETESIVQKTSEVDVSISKVGEACYNIREEVQSAMPVEVSQQSTVDFSEENAAGVICADSETVQEVVEECKIIEETKVTKGTSIVSQESQKVSKAVDEIIEVCGNTDAQTIKEIETIVKTSNASKKSLQKSQSVNEVVSSACYAAEPVIKSVDVSQQSQQKTESITEVVSSACYAAEPVTKSVDVSQQSQKKTESITEVVSSACYAAEPVIKSVDVSQQSQKKTESITEVVSSACYAAEPITKSVDVSQQFSVSTESYSDVDTVDAATRLVNSAEWCGVQEINNKDEVTQSLTTKTTEVHQDSSKTIVEKCTTNIETKRVLNVEMFLEATSKFSDSIEEDSEVLITAKFVNPLATPLTEGKFWIEADNLGKPYCFEIPHIDAGETVICRALIFPRCAGYEFIVARFISREIKRIVGFTNIRVSRAISCESTNETIVSKIVNQKVVATKKM